MVTSLRFITPPPRGESEGKHIGSQDNSDMWTGEKCQRPITTNHGRIWNADWLTHLLFCFCWLECVCSMLGIQGNKKLTFFFHTQSCPKIRTDCQNLSKTRTDAARIPHALFWSCQRITVRMWQKYWGKDGNVHKSKRYLPPRHRLVVIHREGQRLIHRRFNHLDERIVQNFQWDPCVFVALVQRDPAIQKGINTLTDWLTGWRTYWRTNRGTHLRHSIFHLRENP